MEIVGLGGANCTASGVWFFQLYGLTVEAIQTALLVQFESLQPNTSSATYSKNTIGSRSRAQTSHFRLLFTAPCLERGLKLAYSCMLFLAFVLLPRACPYFLTALSPLFSKQPCSLSRTKRVIHERKFGAYI